MTEKIDGSWGPGLNGRTCEDTARRRGTQFNHDGDSVRNSLSLIELVESGVCSSSISSRSEAKPSNGTRTSPT